MGRQSHGQPVELGRDGWLGERFKSRADRVNVMSNEPVGGGAADDSERLLSVVEADKKHVIAIDAVPLEDADAGGGDILAQGKITGGDFAALEGGGFDRRFDVHARELAPLNVSGEIQAVKGRQYGGKILWRKFVQ